MQGTVGDADGELVGLIVVGFGEVGLNVGATVGIGEGGSVNKRTG